MNSGTMTRDRQPLAPPGATASLSARAGFRARLETVLATAFGAIFLGLAAVVAIETISRKLFNVSLQGADELGGYALAVGSTLAFSLALLGRNHIRVDVFHDRFPPRVQALLNWISIVSLAVFALFIAWVAFKVIQDTTAYRSTAQTPWATPLIIPQGVWYAGLVIFALVACALAWRATRLLLGGDTRTLNSDFHPKSAKEELKEELDDLKARQHAEGAAR
ncbi:MULTISPECIES: TRAP transporter small permease subunit [unclassified Variovorax]|jgi:TRAP-type C4-dicarboxylate transport system permease small subunit|uniref:TRAP transporter small permease subunit n=1 Tax=unclassified Variovorax TaxID=663243 RepID=UPI0008BA827C|nr:MULTISPECIES: TRAP transporter small permease [unclassified Variovorax]SEK16341.1 TRAP-type C4-dicarboxylate transport system, small permease component [Variovorax sp. OK202]SFE38967.1 TRAP-type C4-dicarboxylate transport system, small permease component [Variovorax sp. OK212]